MRAAKLGGPGWGGPCPPPGHGAHRYVFTLYTLGVDKLDAIGKATLAGNFGRKK